jgi:cobalt-zinc-cadmium resistance protein CzcA
LNGIVLIGYFNQLKKEGMKNIKERITTGSRVRLRPVIMTAAVASLGFLPMAISTSGGAEVQRPLATVVIGGLITATFLTLIILPILYYWLEKWSERKANRINVSKGGVLGILLMLGLSFSAQAQEQALDLDSAISMAITNHPNLKAASLEVEKNKSLQNLKYNLGTTDISYQGDGLVDRQFGQQVNQFGVVQNFPSPGITKAQNKLQDAYTSQSSTQQQITENELKWKVKQLYFEIQYKKELERLYSNLVSTYKEYHRKSTVRVQAGAASRIEELTLQSKWKEYELLFNQVKIEIANLNKRFQLLLNTKESITTINSLSVANYFTQIDTATNPLLLKSQQEIAVENAKVDAMKAELKPSFNVGYAAQNFNQGGWLNAAQAGVAIPLFNGQTKKRIAAQEKQIEIGNYQYQSTLLSFKQDQLEIQNTLNLYQAGVDFYKNQIETINPEIIRISELNYQAGEISYLELLNTLQLMTTNNKNYWEQILAYNKAVADFQFLTNQ